MVLNSSSENDCFGICFSKTVLVNKCVAVNKRLSCKIISICVVECFEKSYWVVGLGDGAG